MPDNTPDNDCTDQPIRDTVYSMQIVDNNVVSFAEESTTPGESCANCCYYAIYEDITKPLPILEEVINITQEGQVKVKQEEQKIGEVYIQPPLFNGVCFAPNEVYNMNTLLVNVRSNQHCPLYESKEAVFEDDTIHDDMEGRMV